MTTLTETVKATAAEALQIVRLLDAASGIQWEASPVPKPREDTTQRAKGGHGDPTADIVTDPRRLAVREAVTDAERALTQHLAILRHTRHELARAVEVWNGESIQ
jgi:hypothetical protein